MTEPTTTRSAARRAHWLLNGGLLAGFGLMVIIVSAHDPASSSWLPPCPFRALSGGLLCPGCGTLRGLHQLRHGHLGEAFALNPAMVLSLPLLALYGLGTLLRRRNPDARWTRPPHLAWISLALICAWWLGRNL